MIGVDYASVDGNARPDFTAARTAGCRFAIVRGAYGTYRDPVVARDRDAIRSSGLVFGAYLFPRIAIDQSPPEVQVSAFAAAIGPLMPGDLPPTIDVEFPRGITATGLTRSEILAWIRRAVRALRTRYGIAPMIYTSARVWDGSDSDALDADMLVPAPDLLECPLWLARYRYATRKPAVGATAGERAIIGTIADPPVPEAWGLGNVWIHQFQGDSVLFPGFTATVDVNRFITLGRGSTGARVLWAQRRLGIYEGTPGVYDEITDGAVRAFQVERALAVDGVIGPRTFSHLAWCRGWPDEIDDVPTPIPGLD